MAVDQAKSKESGAIEDVSVLRIGVVKDRQLIDERLIQPGGSVSIGSDRLCTFILEGEEVSSLGESFTLFESKGDNYNVIFSDDMKGMIKAGDASFQLEELISSQKAGKKGKNYYYQIEQDFKGKLEVGSYNFLFQFVKVPAVAIKDDTAFQPKLLEEDDYVFIGFLVLYMIVLSAGVLWVASQERPELLDKEEVQELVAQYLDVPDEVDEPEKPDEEPSNEPNDMPTDPTKTVEKAADPTETAPVEKQEAPPQEVQDKKVEATKNMSAEQRAAAEAAVEQSFLFQALATTGASNSGTFVSSAFGGEGDDGADLDAVLDGVTDGQMAQTDAQMKVKGQMDKSGRAIANAEVKKAGKGGKVGAGTGPKTTAPKSAAKIQKIEAAGGECSDAITKTVRKYLSQVTACHNSSLKSNPNVKGRIVVDVEIAGGKVMMAKVSSNKTGDSGLGACIEKRIKRWKFPSDCSDFVSLPFALSPKQ